MRRGDCNGRLEVVVSCSGMMVAEVGICSGRLALEAVGTYNCK